MYGPHQLAAKVPLLVATLVIALMKTGLGIVAQACIAVGPLIGVPAARVGLSLRGLGYVPLGVILGVAEAATSIALCELGIRAYNRLPAGGRRPITPRAWTDYSRGGWMGILRTI